jgi:hypothetical protein
MQRFHFITKKKTHKSYLFQKFSHHTNVQGQVSVNGHHVGTGAGKASKSIKMALPPIACNSY